MIFTSSGVGVTGFMNISPYSSTKGALEALAKCLRIEYAKDINSKRFIICHNLNQKIQTLGCYLLPTKMGDMLSKLTANCNITNDL